MMQHSDTAYETVIGLEVHAQLLTTSKLFCGDSAAFGSDPNTHISPITLGHPGTLPLLNREAVDHAVRLGLACHCRITPVNWFARKNYFYPDLPKGYQISQHTTPVCVGGRLSIQTPSGVKDIPLNRIHLEEDAGKSLHDLDPESTSLDFNRAGVALVEIVTEPSLSSAQEAFAFLTELRKLVRHLGVCDGNMEEGSLRCDANISVRPRGQAELGTKVEVKNLNSIRNVRRAIEFESARLIEILNQGGRVVQQTRSFDAAEGTSFALRDKEEANDYRYFPDPDLVPFVVSEEMIEKIRMTIPELPEQKTARYRSAFQLPEYDARVIAEDRSLSAYYEDIAAHTRQYKAAANWLLGPVKSWLNENAVGVDALVVKPETIAELIELVASGRISFSAASAQVFPELVRQPAKKPEQIALEKNLLQDADETSVNEWVDQVLGKLPEKVHEYRQGKKGLLGLFVGEVKKVSKGKADPKLTNDILLKKLQP